MERELSSDLERVRATFPDENVTQGQEDIIAENSDQRRSRRSAKIVKQQQHLATCGALRVGEPDADQGSALKWLVSVNLQGGAMIGDRDGYMSASDAFDLCCKINGLLASSIQAAARCSE